MAKVIIQDLVKKFSKDTEEKELPEGTTIRFEFKHHHIECRVDGNELKIYKVTNGGSDYIRIKPAASNVVFIE